MHIKKNELLYYNEYEKYYNMVENNNVFSRYLSEVFGKDLSQDGFCDINQIDDLINILSINNNSRLLDVGCGNGKVAEYIYDNTGASAHGFDYSKNAISHASMRTKQKAERLSFKTGLIDEIDYPKSTYDFIISIDTVYFSTDLISFISNSINWLKDDGVYAVFYSEGHMGKATENKNNTKLAKALNQLNIKYEVTDFTKQHYELMKRKRKVANRMMKDFFGSGIKNYYYAAIGQSISKCMSYKKFKQKYSRYLYLFSK